MKWPWRWRKIRAAQIPIKDRDIFELCGDEVVRNMLAGAVGVATPYGLDQVYHDVDRRANAAKWITEQVDLHERREERLEFIECAILTFVVVGVLFDLVGVIVDLFLLKNIR